jgi:acetyltransferase-like isoleucine patch superfamily enzyme
MFDLLKWRLRRINARIRYGQWLRVFGTFTIEEPRNVSLGHEVALNHGVYILGRCGIRIGNFVTLSANCMLLDSGLDIREAPKGGLRKHRDANIEIGDRVWIGAGAIVLAGVTVGPDSVIGAGSVVTRDVPSNTLVAGNPAKIIRELSPPLAQASVAKT